MNVILTEAYFTLSDKRYAYLSMACQEDIWMSGDLHALLTFAMDRGERPLHAPATLIQAKKPLYPLDRTVDESQS